MLPSIPENMKYGTPITTSFVEFSGLFISNDGKLNFTSSASIENGTVYTITIPVEEKDGIINVTKVNSRRALLKHDLKVRYISTNSKIAKVDTRTGVVTGVKKGKCKIYCVAINGVKATVDVTIK